jgi:hypothetical protein
MQNRTTCRTRPNIRGASELLSPRNYLGNPERWSIAFQPEEETETAMLNTIMGTNPIHSFSALDWLPECNSHSCKIRRQVVDIGLLIARLVSSLGRVFSATMETPSLAAQLRNRKSCCYLHKKPAAFGFDLADDLDTNAATRLKQGAMRTSIAEGLR